jgi:hypothetical protein
MFVRIVSVFVTDHSAVWTFLICFCTLVTELTAPRNRRLIPALAFCHSH